MVLSCQTMTLLAAFVSIPWRDPRKSLGTHQFHFPQIKTMNTSNIQSNAVFLYHVPLDTATPALVPWQTIDFLPFVQPQRNLSQRTLTKTLHFIVTEQSHCLIQRICIPSKIPPSCFSSQTVFQPRVPPEIYPLDLCTTLAQGLER